MELIVVPGYAEVGSVGSDVVVSEIATNRDLHLGVATGSSPLSLYAAMAERRGALWDFSGLTVSCLDEYLGLPEVSEQTYRNTVIRTVLQPLGIPIERLTSPDAWSPSPEGAADDFDAFLRAHPVDVQIAGIGANGHVAFNEPHSGLLSRTRVASLTQATREANARFFPSLDDVPRRCITQGLGTILESKMLVMLVSGEAKAEALDRAVNGPITAACPASILQLHPNAVVIADEAAASRTVRVLTH